MGNCYTQFASFRSLIGLTEKSRLTNIRGDLRSEIKPRFLQSSKLILTSRWGLCNELRRRGFPAHRSIILRPRRLGYEFVTTPNQLGDTYKEYRPCCYRKDCFR